MPLSSTVMPNNTICPLSDMPSRLSASTGSPFPLPRRSRTISPVGGDIQDTRSMKWSKSFMETPAVKADGLYCLRLHKKPSLAPLVQVPDLPFDTFSTSRRSKSRPKSRSKSNVEEVCPFNELLQDLSISPKGPNSWEKLSKSRSVSSSDLALYPPPKKDKIPRRSLPAEMTSFQFADPRELPLSLYLSGIAKKSKKQTLMASTLSELLEALPQGKTARGFLNSTSGGKRKVGTYSSNGKAIVFIPDDGQTVLITAGDIPYVRILNFEKLP